MRHLLNKEEHEEEFRYGLCADTCWITCNASCRYACSSEEALSNV